MVGESALEKTMEQVIISKLEKFRDSHEPNYMGYNDLAILIAYGKTADFPEPEFNAKFIKDFLINQRVFRFKNLSTQNIQENLDVLEIFELINRKDTFTYYMPRDTSTIILVNNRDRDLRSPIFRKGNNTIYNNFRLACYAKMSKHGSGFTRTLF